MKFVHKLSDIILTGCAHLMCLPRLLTLVSQARKLWRYHAKSSVVGPQTETKYIDCRNRSSIQLIGISVQDTLAHI